MSQGLHGDATEAYGAYVRIANPIRHLVPRATTSMATWSVEGRSGVMLSLDRSERQRWVDRADPHAGFAALWMATTNVKFIDPRLWDDAGTVEAGPWFASTWPAGRNTLHVRVGARGGVVYRNPGPGITSKDRYDVEGFLRGTAELSARRPFVGGTRLGVRAFAGGYLAHSPPPLQRRIYLAGADPYETFTNPLLRSRGALFVRPGFHYQATGDANLRGFAPELGGRWALSANLELSRRLLSRRQGAVRSIALEVFGDAGVVDSAAVPSATGRRTATALWDAGVGLVSTHQVGDLEWTMRFELPVFVNRWEFAADRDAGDGRSAFRWSFSLAPSF